MKSPFFMLLFAGFSFGQTMPYQVGWVYTTSSMDSTNMALHGLTVADTGGASGHTVSAVVKITSPDGRVSYGTSGWAYHSEANTTMPVCSGDCYDGLYRVESSGSEEFCPMVSTYIAAAASYADSQVAPYTYVIGVSWSPDSVKTKNGASTFTINIGKSLGCAGSNATVQLNLVAPPGMEFLVNPNPANAQAVTFSGNAASGSWALTTSGNNTVTGNVAGDGLINTAPCSVLGLPFKQAVLKVQP